ncbi:cytochrome P450 [Hypomontagnella monticulosa]|nr:cytochrome P450 [Hypomontagnella monticulosa]
MIPVLKVLCIVTLCFIVQYCIRQLVNKLRYEVGVYHRGCERPPNLRPWDPIFNLDIILSNLKARVEHRVLQLDQKNFNKYGHTLQNPFFGPGTIQTTSVENYQAMMSVQGNNDFLAARSWAMKPMAGLGLIDTDGTVWAYHRRMAKTMFSRAQINDPTNFGVHFRRMMQLLPRDGSTVDLRPLFDKMNMDAQSEFCFGESVETLLPHNEAPRRLMKELSNAMSGTGKRLFAGRWSWLIQDKSYRESCKFVRAYISELIDKALARTSATDDEKAYRVLVYEYSKEAKTREQLIDMLFCIFMPGKDTPGTLLGHVFFACARNPHVWTKLRAEVLSCDIDLCTLTLAKLQSLKYMQNVIYETLRLYPVLDQTARTTRINTTLPRGGGLDGNSPIYLLRDTMVVVNFWCMNRREDIYGPDAHVFRPERWDDNPELLVDFHPFGKGPRSCPGQNLALFWLGYSLCGMAQCIKSVENRDPVQEFVEDIALTHGSLNGVKVGLKFDWNPK